MNSTIKNLYEQLEPGLSLLWAEQSLIFINMSCEVNDFKNLSYFL
jgi:hypothetical protein